ncbi:hypothetical protein TVAGG3_0853890 [Trichomonas vaginalis G3]|uniref:hypothetical protein n=1 Tax=Trichomonas vaginalis (strain ATCC PRA-98 / G3) TaxID=412133 RepID=UPI0021E5E703|nr:hypothetical protein TVAGG3_0853890 [Trichomonas vaginalis G3]KAI5500199.1 hypothetical protein TVAGG3_0853890 [Trichomonas vaginalis G3]
MGAQRCLTTNSNITQFSTRLIQSAQAPQPPRTGTGVRINHQKSKQRIKRKFLQQICSKYLKTPKKTH